jgi:hypothetical protein
VTSIVTVDNKAPTSDPGCSRPADHSPREALPKWDPDADRAEFLQAVANAPRAFDLNGVELLDVSFVWADTEAGTWVPLAEVMREA